ncbi:polysaccharide biosynthesis protein [Gordonia sp. SID5947]|uniref:lipopolysaccharide biosynthesis protein n=1 Tax=Gordonia sp. SID5947 TaxID=2690315 RepID=UPI0013705503|nr:polysaccharide biosynthesis protein [Gordonia sp. SID5947]MYR08098.1 polysaccharide biosynthesis protein [Gordonia sp. SID5947]
MSDDVDQGPVRGTIGRVTVATLIAAASGYLVLLLAARHLGAAGYAVFAVFWAAYGMVTGTQNGQLQETTRAVRAALDTHRTPADRLRARPWLINTTIGLVLAALVAATSPLWSGQVFTDERWLSVLLLSVGVASFAVYAHLAGALSGALAWGPFAVLLSVDALIRLVGAVVAVALDGEVTAFLVITVIGSVSWMAVLLTSSEARAAVGLHGDVTPRHFTGNTVTAMAAAAASAVLVMGFPVLINATGGDDADTATVGAVVLAVTLTRAPLLVPLNSFQGVLITRFVDGRRHLMVALRAPVAVVAAIGVVGSAAAWLVGPWLLTTVFGADFQLAGVTLAAFTLGATALALLTVTGAAAIAVGSHRWYATGWWVATLASAGLLLVPLGVEGRVAIALIGGPIVGMSIHGLAFARRSAAMAVSTRD